MRKLRRVLRENDMVVTGPREEESTSTRNTSSQTERVLAVEGVTVKKRRS